MAQLSREQIEALGFDSLGEDVFISDKASFYNCRHIRLGTRVRIDDFCILSAGEGGIEIGDYVHIAANSSLIGRGCIHLGDFVNLSSRVSIYSSSDDYSGISLTNPMVPEEFKKVHHADVYLGRHVIIGSGSVVLPGSILEDGVAVGALSLIKKRCSSFSIFAGVPARKIGERKRDLLLLEKKLLAKFPL